MRTLIAVVIKAITLVSFVGSCLVVTTFGMNVLPEFQAKYYQDGDTIGGAFPLVVITLNPQTQKLDQLNLVFWRELENFSKEHPLHSFRLQSERGHFVFKEVHHVTFHVNDPGSVVQAVKVEDSWGEQVITGRYQATDKSVTPSYYRLLHIGHAIAAFPIGLGVACLLYYAAWRLTNKRLQATDPSIGTQNLPLNKAVTTLALSKTRWREQ